MIKEQETKKQKQQIETKKRKKQRKRSQPHSKWLTDCFLLSTGDYT